MRPTIGQTAPWRLRSWLRQRGRRSSQAASRVAFVTLVVLVASFIGVGLIMVRVCSAAKSTPPPKAFFAGLPRVSNIAHRGASKSAAEHTLAAYELALAQGADVLEIDLRATRDGVLLVAHDADLERTLGIPLLLAEATFHDITARAGQRAPLKLEDVLSQFRTTRFNLELKDEDPAIAGALARLLRRQAAEDRVLVASRHQEMLDEFREEAGGRVATSASLREVLLFRFCQLMGRSCPTPYAALQVPPLGWLGLSTPAFVAGAHARGLAVHYWTIDEPELQDALIRAGADGIMTNDPGGLEPRTREERHR